MGELSAAYPDTLMEAHVKTPHIWTAHHPTDSILRPSQIDMAGPAVAWRTVSREYVIGEKMTGRVVMAVLVRSVETWLQRLVSAHCRTRRLLMAWKTAMILYLGPGRRPSLAWLR
jgi:hypothetical protein